MPWPYDDPNERNQALLDNENQPQAPVVPDPTEAAGVSAPGPVPGPSMPPGPSAPAAAPVPAPVKPQTDDDILRQAFAKKDIEDRQDFSAASSAANQNRLYAGLGQAAANAGAAIAGAPQQNQEPWQALQKNAEAPLTHLETRQKIEDNKDNKWQNFLLKQAGLNSLNSNRTAKLAQGDRSLDIQGQKADTMAALAHERMGMQRQSLGLREQMLRIRQGNQNLAVVDKIVKDPVVTASSKQSAQADVGISRINDIKAKKIPFTESISNELQSHISIILNGMQGAAAEGKLERIEFRPVELRVQKIFDMMKGNQSDVYNPVFLEQLENQLTGLKVDVDRVGFNRAAKLQKQYSGAVSGNPSAAGAMQTAVDNSGSRGPNENPQPAGSPSPQSGLDAQKKARLEVLRKKQAAGKLGG